MNSLKNNIMIQFENAIKYFNELILSELNELDIEVWVAGGSIRDYMSGQPIKTDYDLFFKNSDGYNKVLSYLEKNNAETIFENENGRKVFYKGKKFDLVKKHFNSPIDTINEFDFTVSMFAVDRNKFYHGETSFIDLAKRQLMINKLPFPGNTLKRAFRYYEKGYRMCLDEMKKLILAINKLELGNQDDESENNNSDDFTISMGSLFKGID